MSSKTKYIIVMIVTWLVVTCLIIIPRFIFKQPIPTIATNATNADIVNAIYNTHFSLQNNVDSIRNTIYVATGILIAIMTRK